MVRNITIGAFMCLAGVIQCSAQSTPAEGLQKALNGQSSICTTRPITVTDFTVLFVRQAPRQITVVQRRGEDNLIFVCDGAGRPIGFGKDRSLTYTSPHFPGQVLKCQDALWSLIVHKDEVSITFKKRSDNLQNTLWWDPGSVASAFLDHGSTIDGDLKNGACRLSIKGFMADFGSSTGDDNIERLDFLDLYHAGPAISVVRLSPPIPEDLDLGRVALSSIDKLNLSAVSIRGDTLADLSFDDDPEEKTKEELLVADALSQVLPFRGCFAEFLSFSAVRRISIASRIALDLSGDDNKLRTKIEHMTNDRTSFVTKICAELKSGERDVASTYNQLEEKGGLAMELSSVLPRDQFIKFSRTWLASPRPLDYAMREWAMRSAILDELELLRLDRNLQYRLSLECVAECDKLEVITSDYFSMRISREALRERMRQVDKETSEMLQSAGLTPDQLAAIFAKSKAADDKYRRNIGI